MRILIVLLLAGCAEFSGGATSDYRPARDETMVVRDGGVKTPPSATKVNKSGDVIHLE